MSMWKHTKHAAKEFHGNYEHDKKTGKRVLFLEAFNAKGKKTNSIKTTSWQNAKKLGWVFSK